MTTDIISSDSGADGYIEKQAISGGPTTYTAYPSASTGFCGGNNAIGGIELLYHSYFSFDTANINDDALLISATLNFYIVSIIKTKAYTPTDWGTILFKVGDDVIGASLSAAAWNNANFTNDSTATGYISTGAKTYTLSGLVNINLIGDTDFELIPIWEVTAPNIAYLSLGMTESGTIAFRPTLSVTYTVGGRDRSIMTRVLTGVMRRGS